MIKGGCLSKKYLLNPEANKEGFEDGWFRTGDVGTLDETGKLRITDRIKNIFKLCQGEYVAPEAVENVIATCPLVGQNFLHGTSTESFTVSIVFPDIKSVTKFLKLKNIIKDDKE